MRYFPLSEEQQSLQFFHGIFGLGVAPNLSLVVHVPSGTSRAAVEQAVRSLCDRHEILRSSLIGPRTAAVTVLPDPPAVLSTDSGTTDGADAYVERRLDAMHVAQLHPRPVHFELVDGTHLLVVIDHLLADGDTVEILAADLQALLAGAELAPRASYAELRDRRRPTEHHREQEAAHWAEALAGYPYLARHFPRAADHSSYVLSQMDHELPDDGFSALLKGMADMYGTTAFSVVAGLTGIAIQHRSGVRKFVLHTPVSTRRDPVSWEAAGNFVQDRPVPVSIDPDQRFADCARALQRSVWDGIGNSRLSVPEIIHAVPEYGDSLLSEGADYVQLHVGVEPVADGESFRLPASSSEPLALGPYLPSHDLTVSTLRFVFTGRRLFMRSFFGGPAEGLNEVERLRRDIVTALALPDLADRKVGEVLDALASTAASSTVS